MKTYMIGYDLNQPGRDYKPLIDAIQRLTSNWWHCLDSTWIIKTNSSVASIRYALSPKSIATMSCSWRAWTVNRSGRASLVAPPG